MKASCEARRPRASCGNSQDDPSNRNKEARSIASFNRKTTLHGAAAPPAVRTGACGTRRGAPGLGKGAAAAALGQGTRPNPPLARRPLSEGLFTPPVPRGGVGGWSAILNPEKVLVLKDLKEQGHLYDVIGFLFVKNKSCASLKVFCENLKKHISYSERSCKALSFQLNILL